MHVDHHPLTKDFPELQQALHELRQSDAHFARQASEYEALDKRICRIEDAVETASDQDLSTLKLQRVALKDALGRRLKQAKGSCCGGCSG